MDWQEVRRLTDVSGSLEPLFGSRKPSAAAMTKQELRRSTLRSTMEWIAGHAPWLLLRRAKPRSDAATPLLADQDEELGLVRSPGPLPTCSLSP